MVEKIILASSSPRRRELLENIGVKFDIVVPMADESKIKRDIAPDVLVRELAILKALQTAKEIKGEHFVISADTVVYHDGKILEKPKNEEDAKHMLRSLSGDKHSVYTGVCVLKTPECRAECSTEKTDVYFRELSEETIEKYVKTGEPMDKAGAYGIQEKGALLVKKIDGDYFNVVGLPLGLLSDIFKNEFDVDLLGKI